MSTPLVSVIVPIYKVEAYLPRCVDSLLAQTLTNIEILLVDDESPDNCPQLCDEYAKKDPRVRVIHKKNGGLSDARNAGIEAATGEYLLFVDSDDFVAETLTEELLTAVREHHADAAFGLVLDCYEGSSLTKPPLSPCRVYSKDETLKNLLMSKAPFTLSSCGKLFPRHTFDTLRFRVGVTYEDAFFTPEAVCHLDTVVVVPSAVYYYWHRKDSITTRPFSLRNFDVIAAHEYNKSLLMEKFPSLQPYCEFRIWWAHFVVLDHMLLDSHFKSLERYGEIVAFLRKNYRNIVRCPYFSKGRRLAALILKFSVPLYRRFMLLDQKNKGMNQ